MFTIQELVQITHGSSPCVSSRARVGGVSTDTRTITRGELFIALCGERCNGHDFVDEALRRGARALLIARKRQAIGKRLARDHARVPVIVVDDPLQTLGDIAAAYRARFSLPVIGITGSVGKTTTKDMLACLLGGDRYALKSPASFNNRVGVPLTLLQLRRTHRFAVIEMGTASLGQITRLSQIAQPTIGIITTIGAAHLASLGTLDHVFQAKRELYDFIMPRGGKMIVNGDDAYLKALACADNVQRYGFSKQYDIWANRCERLDDITLFRVCAAHWMALRLNGRGNVANFLAAAAAARLCGVSWAKIRERAAYIKPARYRLESQYTHGVDMILDCYNANPLSMAHAIEYLRAKRVRGKRLIVAGDMLELGKTSNKFHEHIGTMIADASIDRLIAIGSFARDVVRGARRSGMKTSQLAYCASLDEVCAQLQQHIQPGDAVLIKGSRALELEKIPCSITFSTP